MEPITDEWVTRHFDHLSHDLAFGRVGRSGRGSGAGLRQIVDQSVLRIN